MKKASRFFVYIFIFLLLPLGAGAKVKITEIAASEGAGFEWIEIVNHGNATVDLADWKFFEADTNHKLSVARGGSVLPPGQYAVIAQDANKFLTKYPEVATVLDSSWSSLKESGEYIAIKNNTGEVEEGFTYLAASNGFLARVDISKDDYTALNWRELEIASPGKINNFAAPAPTSNPPPNNTETAPPPINNPPAENSATTTFSSTSSSSSSQNTSAENRNVLVEGTVIVPPGLFGVRVAYIQADTGAYEIYSYQGDFPELNVNDRVTVTGEFGTNEILPRIKIKTSTDIKIVGKDNILPRLIALSELDQKDIGQLLEIKGILIEIRGAKRFFVEDDGKEIEVVLKNNTGLSLPRTEEGSKVTVSGVLGYRDGSFILYPRFSSDLGVATIKRATTRFATDKNNEETVTPLAMPITPISPRTANAHTARNIGLTFAFLGISSIIGLVIRHREKLFKKK